MDESQTWTATATEGVRAAATDPQLRLLIDAVRDYAIFLLDPAGRVVSWNAGAERIKGYRSEEILGRHFSRFYTEADRAANKPERELEIARTKGRFEDEGWRVRKDGSLFWANVVITAVRDEHGEFVGFAKVTRDLTERRRAEENARRLVREEARRQAAEESERRLARLHIELANALAEREAALRRLADQRARLDAMLRKMPVGVVIVDARDRRYTYANDEAVRLLGGNPVGERLGAQSSYRELRPDGSPYAPEESPLARALDRGETVTGEEVTLLTAGGSRLTVALHATPIREADGGIASAIAAFQDVTPLKQARELAELQARLREQFVAILGHDLRSPLAAITAGAHMLLRRGLDASQARVVDRIVASAERTERMIRDLLDLTQSRLGGGIPVTPTTIDMRAIGRGVVEEYAAAHPDVEIRLEARGNTWGEWDADRIAQVISNLLGNAISYGRRGGAVHVRVEEDAANDGVSIEVHNEGPAIPDDVRPVLFDPFQRGRDGASSARGLGLGLYIANQIVLAHGGRIDVRSSAAEGTSFTVRLPRQQRK